MSRIKLIRLKEKDYHEKFYENNELFDQGSWLNKPVKSVLYHFEDFDYNDDLQILDLGCGVGRNSIPLARLLENDNSKAYCVDLLEKAINQLKVYSKKYGVAHKIQGILSSIEDYEIKPEMFDFVVSISALEHLRSIDVLKYKMSEIENGVKTGGKVCFVLNTSVSEICKLTGKELDPQFEINLSKNEMQNILDEIFADWSIIENHSKKYMFRIERNGNEVELITDCVTFIAKKN